MPRGLDHRLANRVKAQRVVRWHAPDRDRARVGSERRHDLAGQPGLPDPRVADHRGPHRRAGTDRPAKGGAHPTDLVIARDHRGVRSAGDRGDARGQLQNQPAPSLLHGPHDRRPAHQWERACPDQYFAVPRGEREPAGRGDDRPGDDVRQSAGGPGDDDVAGVDPRARPGSRPAVGVVRLHLESYVEHGPHRTQGIVLVAEREAEERDQLVTERSLDAGAVAHQDFGGDMHRRGSDVRQRLRVLVHVGGWGHVDDRNGHPATLAG
jgi:hypothetical protein